MTESVAGTVTMADGTTRDACRNTYERMVDVDGGRSMEKVTETRIEFRLFRNVNNPHGPRFRKVTAKQAATFAPE